MPRSKLELAVDGVRKLSARADAIDPALVQRELKAGHSPPVTITLELSGTEFVPHFVEFLRYIQRTASGGHSFMIAADEDSDGPHQMFGSQKAAAVCHIDGDGSDKIGRILLNGKDVTKAEP